MSYDLLKYSPMTLKLDALDRKIFAILDTNARMSTSDIARKVRHGRDIVHYRVERLFREGILVGTQAIINPYQLGFTLFKSYVRLKNDQRRAKSLLARLEADPNVFCVALCDGSWDLIFNTLAVSPYHFDQIQSRLLAESQTLIIESDLAVVINQALYSRGFVSGKQGKPFLLGGEPRIQSIAAVELVLLDLLARDARISVSELARAADSSVAVVQRRIERLEETGIIVGYRAIPSFSALQMTNFKVQLELSSYAPKDLASLREFVAQHAYITKVIGQLGAVRLELGVEAHGYEHFNSIAQEIRGAFPDLILSVSTILVREEKYRWLNRGVSQGVELVLNGVVAA